MLVYAILFSAIWHIFWLSAFKVVVVPKVTKPVKFSSVAFLGQILDKSVLSVDVKPHERTERELAYLDSMAAPRALLAAGELAPGVDALPVFDTLCAADEEEFIGAAISGMDTNKLEPGRDVD